MINDESVKQLSLLLQTQFLQKIHTFTFYPYFVPNGGGIHMFGSKQWEITVVTPFPYRPSILNLDITSRPGRSQGLLYKHLCDSLIK